MSYVQIQSVQLQPFAGKFVTNAMLDLPAAGSEQAGYSLRLEGWAVSREQRPDAIAVYLGDHQLHESPTIVEREDVKAYFGLDANHHAAGYYANLDTLLFPADFELTVKLVFGWDNHETIGVIRGRRSTPTFAFQPSLQPLLVYALGRSGTTLLMRYLSNHPQLIAYSEYPYELRMASYMFHAFGVLNARSDYYQSSGPDTFVKADNWLGFSPFNEPKVYSQPVIDWFDDAYREQTAAFAMGSLESFYRHLAAAQHKPHARYFVEKIQEFARRQYQWVLYPQSRALLIVRDFRDRHSSVLSFNAKRGGVAGFGMAAVDSEEEFILKTRRYFTSNLENLRQHPQQMQLVRYEDLILNERETLLKIVRFLELDDAPAVIDRMMNETHVDTPNLKHHRTTENSAQSVGRWKRDLDPKKAALYNEVFRDILEELGYET